MKVKCDVCGELFAVKLKESNVIGFTGVRERFFNCTKCNEKYRVNFIDNKTEDLRIQFEKIQSRAQKKEQNISTQAEVVIAKKNLSDALEELKQKLEMIGVR